MYTAHMSKYMEDTVSLHGKQVSSAIKEGLTEDSMLKSPTQRGKDVSINASTAEYVPFLRWLELHLLARSASLFTIALGFIRVCMVHAQLAACAV
ncbi:hypothetical protein GCM10010129_82240 [Streptomyces fumigatiscleroticus]|nr:hypothetical protein GCM10010129_82240 [Streptomyces fumigatiscleroticus]